MTDADDVKNTARRDASERLIDPVLAPSGDLKGRSARGGLIALSAQGIKFLLGLVWTAILARLLLPGDFGLIAMVTPIVGFFGTFQDLGLTMATVQRERITPDQVSTLFWINVAISGLLATMIAACSPAVAWFYDEPRLTDVTLALGLLLFFSGVSAQHFALLRRRMLFTRLAIIEPSALFIGMVAGVTAAWWGLGYWALVIMTGTEALSRLIMAWSASGWTPGRPARGAGVRDMLAFGGHLTGANLIYYIVHNIDNVLMGKFWGETALGLYNRAYTLSQLTTNHINQPVSNVVIPMLSRLQNDPEPYRRHYVTALGLTTSLSMPIIAFAVADAELLITGLLGERWLEAIPLFQALGPAAFMATTHVSMTWVFVSLGKSNRQFRWSIVAGVTIVTAFVIGLPYGAMGMAIAYSSATVALRLPGIVYCYHGTRLRLRDFFRAVQVPAVASLGAAAVLLGLRGWMDHSFNGIVQLLLDATVYGLGYLTIYAAFPQGRKNILLLRNLADGIVAHLVRHRGQSPAGRTVG